jgi:hypothetical protein
MNDRFPPAPSIGSSRVRRAAVPRFAAACSVALAVATVGLVAQQPKGGPPVSDKQRKNLVELAEPWPDAAVIAKRRADAENRALFQSSEPLEFRLEADFKTVQRDRDPASTTLYPATLTAPGADGQPVTIQVQLRNRGILRRKAQTCDFPPLRIEFPKDDKADLKRSLFDGIKHIKLSTHCKGGSDFEQYVLREYLAYRTYNLITPWSLRVRLAKATYVDATNGKPIATKFAFFIEKEEDLAKRMEGRVAILPRTALVDHDIDALTQAALFSFMVGNTDYSVFLLHNVFLVQAQDKKLHAVVYDFDVTGLVNPPYARPLRSFFLDSVKDRLYRGPCRPAEQLEPLLATYRPKKEEILRLYAADPALTSDSKQQMTEYVEEFYDIINDPGRTKRKLVSTCNKEVW